MHHENPGMQELPALSWLVPAETVPPDERLAPTERPMHRVSRRVERAWKSLTGPAKAPRADGSREQVWHCVPFSEGAQYGIELFYPCDRWPMLFFEASP